MVSHGAFSPITPSFGMVTPNPNMQHSDFRNHFISNPNVQLPGVNPFSIMPPGVASGVGSVRVFVSPLRPPVMLQGSPNQAPDHTLRSFGQMPNRFPIIPTSASQMILPLAGIPHYSTPYTAMIRLACPPCPPGVIGVLPPLSHCPVPGILGVPPITPPVLNPVVPVVAPTEKLQTTIYIGKIAPTVEDDFMLSILLLCGHVKSWKRAQDPTDGTLRGFGFCQFDSAEGVLRSLRLLSKFNVDGQELVLNVNQATRKYLKRYVEKRRESEKKLKETESEGSEKEDESAPGVQKIKSPKPLLEDSKKDGNELGLKENHDAVNFGIVTEKDQQADRDALEKLTSMMEERIKTKPLPLPPMYSPAYGSGNSNSEVPSKLRDGDSDMDIDAADDKNDEETTNESKCTSERDRPETSSPEVCRRHDRRKRDSDREQEKERELERYHRKMERERVRRQREREMKNREDEHLYQDRVKEWDSRVRMREYYQLREREREKDWECERRREIMNHEDESNGDDTRKRRRMSSLSEEKRKKRQWEKEADFADRLREEGEIVEAKRSEIEEPQQQKYEFKIFSSQVTNGSEKIIMPEETDVENKDNAVEQAYESDSGRGNHAGYAENGTGGESTSALDMMQSNNSPTGKLVLDLEGSGKRIAVPSLFNEEEHDDAQKEKKMKSLVPNDDAQKEKKMKSLVPNDYSTDDLQPVQHTVLGTPWPNLAATAEFSKHISNIDPKALHDADRERNRQSNDRSTHLDQDWNDEENNCAKNENIENTLDRDRDLEHVPDKMKTPENNLLGAKQLIDMIPKSEELFSYEINWGLHDKAGIQSLARDFRNAGSNHSLLCNHPNRAQALSLCQRTAESETSSIVEENSQEVKCGIWSFPFEDRVELGPSGVSEQAYESDSGHVNHAGNVILEDRTADDSIVASDMMLSNNSPARNLGFDMVELGKRTVVHRLFHVEDHDDAQKEKKMRSLVPIDYSTEELQPTVIGAPLPNLATTAEFLKRIFNINPTEERTDAERERNKRSNDWSTPWDQHQNDEESNFSRNENIDNTQDQYRNQDQGPDKLKTPERNLFGVKQLIDMIPKTEEVSYEEINWATYDKVQSLVLDMGNADSKYSWLSKRPRQMKTMANRAYSPPLRQRTAESETPSIVEVTLKEVGCGVLSLPLEGRVELGPSGVGEQAYEGDFGRGTHADTIQSNNSPAKLGFGLVGSRELSAIPSLLHEEDYDDPQEKNMGPLVPIDYSTEELQPVQPTVFRASAPNLAATTEFTKHISDINPKEEMLDAERERKNRSNEKPTHRDQDRNDDESNLARNENRDKTLNQDREQEPGPVKLKTSENKLFNVKQLIDKIPKTEESFSCEINWAVYDKAGVQSSARNTDNIGTKFSLLSRHPSQMNTIRNRAQTPPLYQRITESLTPSVVEETSQEVRCDIRSLPLEGQVELGGIIKGITPPMEATVDVPLVRMEVEPCQQPAIAEILEPMPTEAPIAMAPVEAIVTAPSVKEFPITSYSQQCAVDGQCTCSPPCDKGNVRDLFKSSDHVNISPPCKSTCEGWTSMVADVNEDTESQWTSDAPTEGEGSTIVGGYKVSRSSAPVLRAVFNRHRDIASGCRLKDATTRAFFLEVVCSVVKEMHQKSVKSLERSDLERWDRLLADSEAVGIQIDWIKTRTTELASVMDAASKFAAIEIVRKKQFSALEAAKKGLEDAKATMAEAKANLSAAVMHVVAAREEVVLMEGRCMEAKESAKKAEEEYAPAREAARSLLRFNTGSVAEGLL